MAFGWIIFALPLALQFRASSSKWIECFGQDQVQFLICLTLAARFEKKKNYPRKKKITTAEIAMELHNTIMEKFYFFLLRNHHKLFYQIAQFFH